MKTDLEILEPKAQAYYGHGFSFLKKEMQQFVLNAMQEARKEEAIKLTKSWKKEEEIWNEEHKIMSDFLTANDDEYPQLNETNSESLIRYAKGLQNRIKELDSLGTISIEEQRKHLKRIAELETELNELKRA